MRPQLTSNEKLTLLASGLALLLSVGSSVYTILRDRRNEEERVVVHLARRRDDYMSQIFRAAGSVSQVSLEWKLLVANNGAIPLSIIDYEVWGHAANRYSYTRMDLGVFRADGVRATFPIVIEPGHAEGLVLRMGYWLPNAVQRAADEAIDGYTRLPFHELEKRLARKRLDIFGNPVTISERGDEHFIIGPSLPLKQPTFGITIRTARGQDVSSTFKFY